MSGLGISVIGRRPIGALRVPPNGPTFAKLTAAGVGTFSAVAQGKASSTLAAAGVGAFNAVSGPASGVLQASGVGAFSSVSASKANASVTSAGIGSFSGTLAALGNTSLSAAGSGAFAPVMRAQVSSTTTMQGSSTMGGSDAPASAASFAGTGALAAVSYAFFADAEVAGPRNEPRGSIVRAENRRAAVVLAEDRGYQGDTRPTAPVIPNRKRLL